ncbi:hypothetical protein [Thermococcus sp. CX2]|uniref:hypothetical protein n=1 Tax=Thermococcus sp. CX2 TaxID=163006 RepID=UPI00197E69D0|nr:hypothetical protein [Thermococcus sp. CX2]
MSIVIGVALRIVGYNILKRARVMNFPEVVIFSLALAFGGFLLGEFARPRAIS